MAPRMDLGFGNAASAEGDALDLTPFAPRRARVDAPALETARRAAEAAGFRSREPGRGEAARNKRAGEGASSAASSASAEPDTTSRATSRTKRGATAGAGKARKPAAKPVASVAEASETAPATVNAAPAPVTAYGRPPRRRRTGRNVQFNIKARPETIEAFTAIADRRDWGFGETLEHAVALLEREYGG